jgi:glucose-6-phosphate 1-dehydrogenase
MRHLREEQVFRIDHYLGKDTVQNLLAFRFGNGIFEPIFDHHHVDHIQITVAEPIGMEHGRGEFYHHTGSLRDVLQNHALQLLALIAMEPPAVAGAREIRDEKVKVLRCLRGGGDSIGSWVVRGQYGRGIVGGKEVPAFREEERVPVDSCAETYVAMRVRVDNWRWAGVPFIIRTGKRLATRMTEIAVVFEQPPTQYFRTVRCVDDVCAMAPRSPNAIVFRIQPNEGVSLRLSVKRPGMNADLCDVDMRFSYGQAFHEAMPDAYERLLLDVLRGDQTLFTRSDEIEAAWEFVTPVLDNFASSRVPAFPNYPAGSMGPAEADRLLDGCACGWWEGCP